jgi:hypothetical protein
MDVYLNAVFCPLAMVDKGAAFALCLCWELPTVLQTLVQEGGGALLTPTLLFRLGLCCVGALGALSAVRCTRTEQGA